MAARMTAVFERRVTTGVFPPRIKCRMHVVSNSPRHSRSRRGFESGHLASRRRRQASASSGAVNARSASRT
jgi:hypothetical protein